MMKKRKILLVCIVFSCITGKVNAQSSTKTYQEDATDFSNPERGFYHQWLSDSKSPSTLNSYFQKQMVRNCCGLKLSGVNNSTDIKVN